MLQMIGTLLMGIGLGLAALLDILMVVDALQWWVRPSPDTTAPMGVAIAFFTFPLYLSTALLTYWLWHGRGRRAVMGLALSPLALAAIIMVTAGWR